MEGQRSALVIDNNPIRRAVVADTLVQFGLRVATVGTRADALDLYEAKHDFDLVAMRIGSKEELSADATAKLIRGFRVDSRPYIVGMSPVAVNNDAVLLSEMDVVVLWPLDGKQSVQNHVGSVLHSFKRRDHKLWIKPDTNNGGAP